MHGPISITCTHKCTKIVENILSDTGLNLSIFSVAHVCIVTI